MQINFFKLSLSLPEDKPESNISLEFNETTLIEWGLHIVVNETLLYKKNCI